MDLVPVKKKTAATMENPSTNHAIEITNTADEKPTEFTIAAERQQQIGVTYAAVEKKTFKQNIRSVGLVASDKRRHWDYVARTEGYVQELFVFSRGEFIEKGAPILTIYSPDLLTTETEFVDVLNRRDQVRGKSEKVAGESFESLLQSARQRLRLWNISDDQISDLEKSRKPQEMLTLHSPFKGVVQDIGVDQGRKVMIGDHLVDVADLSTVWVWAQFYQDDLPLLKKGLPVTITSSSIPGEKLCGEISVIDPFINEMIRTVRVRIDVPNRNYKLRPGMFVDVDSMIDLGEGLAVPTLAVLPTGKHDIAFVDKGDGKLEPRFINLGRKFGDFYEVRDGLKDHERVVTSANFLIDAEAKVQGALKSW